MPLRPSTRQVIGALFAILLGVITTLISGDRFNGVVITLLVGILTVVVDLYYSVATGGMNILDIIRSHEALKDYERCIQEYPSIIARLREATTPQVGLLLVKWVDAKIRNHHVDVRDGWAIGRISFPANEVEERSVQVQRTIHRGGFATQLEHYMEFWEAAPSYVLVNQELVGLGTLDITRVFILKAEQSLKNDAVSSQIRADKAAGIKTLVAFTTGAHRITNQEAIKDFGIWDEQLLCLIDVNPHTLEVIGSTYSILPTDLEEARRWREHILLHAVDSDRYLSS